MNLTKSLLFAGLTLITNVSLNAQDIFLDASTQGKTIYTDGATFYDSGRNEGRYSNFEDLSTTICSTTGDPLGIQFFDFFLEEDNDLLYISYGTGDDMRTVPGSPFSGESLKGHVLTSSEACMTFRMTTDFNIMRSGWDAEIFTTEPLVILKE